MRAKKIELGKEYYYGHVRRRFTCTKVGKELSFFTDWKKGKYQFYNEDIHIDQSPTPSTN